MWHNFHSFIYLFIFASSTHSEKCTTYDLCNFHNGKYCFLCTMNLVIENIKILWFWFFIVISCPESNYQKSMLIVNKYKIKFILSWKWPAEILEKLNFFVDVPLSLSKLRNWQLIAKPLLLIIDLNRILKKRKTQDFSRGEKPVKELKELLTWYKP